VSAHAHGACEESSAVEEGGGGGISVSKGYRCIST
jgi:hypothetical protein